MKQKQVKASLKVPKQTKKAPPPKKVQDVLESSEEVEKKMPKKTVNKKPAKVVEVAFEEHSDDDREEVEEDDEEVVDNEDDEVEESEDAVSDEDDGEEDEEKDDDEIEVDEGNDDDVEDDEDNDDDDDEEAPSEEAIEKEEPTIPSKVKIGPIPPSVPLTQIVKIRNLSKNCKKIEIVEAFAKYGSIDQIHIIDIPTGSVAIVAYKTEKAALAALADNQKVKVNDTLVSVSMQKEGISKKLRILQSRERTVYVKFIKSGTTKREIKEHFESCGEIESVSLKTKISWFAFVTFTDKSAVPAALKLHNSLLNGGNISVTEYDDSQEKGPKFGDRLTVTLRNKQNFQNIDVAKLEAIFSKCGEIDNMVAVCKKNVLAFITFKTKQGVHNAINLSGKTEQGIDLKVELCNPIKKWTTIHVTNLPKDCSVDDLTKIFSKAGKIVSVLIKGGHAAISFTDSDGYCKSFLYNESLINGNVIFVEPHSYRKQTVYKGKKPFPNKGFKRSFDNGNNGVFRPKRSRIN